MYQSLLLHFWLVLLLPRIAPHLAIVFFYFFFLCVKRQWDISFMIFSFSSIEIFNLRLIQLAYTRMYVLERQGCCLIPVKLFFIWLKFKRRNCTYAGIIQLLIWFSCLFWNMNQLYYKSMYMCLLVWYMNDLIVQT